MIDADVKSCGLIFDCVQIRMKFTPMSTFSVENILELGISRIFRRFKRSKCAVKMIKLNWTRRKTTAAVLLCAILVSTVAFWQMNQNAQAAVLNPHPGLVGWWRFDEGTGNITSDSSGNGNTGTIYGATWGTGVYGQALSFDGATNYVEIPSSSILAPSSMTIEFWVKIANPSSNAYEGFVCRNSRINGLQVIKEWNTGKVLFEGWVGSTHYSLDSNYVLQSNAWTHIAVTAATNGTWKIYVNGQLNVQSTGNVLPQVAMPLWIGRAAQGTTNPYLNGNVDEARIYNRDLSAAEIQQDFQNGPDFSSNLLAKVPMGTTQVITTLSWQGTASINVTIVSPSQTYTESTVPVYQKTTYSTSGGISSMLNIKRLSISVNALPSDQNWNITLTYDTVSAYQMSVEVQK